jgi:hypothetical protein
MTQTANVIDFNPKDGKQPKWKYIYDAIKDYDYDTEFSYAQLEAMTGLTQQKIQTLKKKVDREFKKADQKMLVNIRGFGYRIASPTCQVKQAETHEGKGRRQLKWAAEVLDNMDTSKMTIEEKNRWMDYNIFVQNKLHIMRKRSLKSLDMTQTAVKNSKKSEKEQKKTLGELNDMISQIEDLKNKLKS